jgi:adenosylcobinamide kinase/adenosylcobinamide-phosphate guanylyltransferase
MGKLILILGGARSGKSSFAQHLASELAGEDVLFVATAEAGDEEMRQRIERHRRERPPGWRTLETPREIGPSILEHGQALQVILLDCLTLLVSNHLVAFDDPSDPQAEQRVMAQVHVLVECAQLCPADLIVVSNEVGMGLVPPTPLGRAYRDLLGKANQVLAQKADRVYFLVAGLPMTLKG